MDTDFHYHLDELTGLSGPRLADPGGLSAVAVAGAVAVGMAALGSPVVRTTPTGLAIALLCRAGHIVLHAMPDEGRCIVAIVAQAPADVGRAMDVIARGLAR